MRRQRNLLGPQGMGGMVSLSGASSLIQSAQKATLDCGASALTGTATITAVNVNNTILLRESVYSNFTTAIAGNATKARVTLTNATTLTATTQSISGTDVNQIVYVIEFVPGVLKSVQYGTVLCSNAASSGTTTITQVTINKSLLLFLGDSTDAAGAWSGLDQRHMNATQILNTDVQIRANRPGTSWDLYNGFCVAEFF